jgi:hypothetical protein
MKEQKSSNQQLSQAALDVLAERRRQIEVEGWTPEHDAEHCHAELATAAACYILGATSGFSSEEYAGDVPTAWPWDPKWWKPKDYRRDLVRAAALLIAEIERSDRDDL